MQERRIILAIRNNKSLLVTKNRGTEIVIPRDELGDYGARRKWYACRIIPRQRSFLPWAISQAERYLHVNHSASRTLSLRYPSYGDHEEVAACSIFNNSLDHRARMATFPVDVRWPPRWTRIKYNRIKSEPTGERNYVPVGSTKSRLSSSGFRRRSPICHINDAINANACQWSIIRKRARQKGGNCCGGFTTNAMIWMTFNDSRMNAQFTDLFRPRISFRFAD